MANPLPPRWRRIFFQLVTLFFVATNATAIDECPSRGDRRNCIWVPPISSYHDFERITGAASPGGKLCFSSFRVSMDKTVHKTTIIKKDIQLVCHEFNSCIFEGGDTVIRISGAKTKALIQGFTFLGADSQAVAISKERQRAKRQMICNCLFWENESVGEEGSALAVLRNANAYLGHCRFKGNKNSYQGGAIYNRGELIVYKTSFEDNQATEAGGAIMNKAGATLDLQNCSFSNNAAGEGSAIYVQGGRDSVRKNLGNYADNNRECNGLFFEEYGCSEFQSITTPVDSNTSTTTPAPNTSPDRIVTPDPSCADHGRLKFYTNGTKTKSCKWLGRELNERVPRFCSGSEEGMNTLADLVCPSMCSKCSGECVDFGHIGFKRNSRGEEKRCDWLNDPKKGGKRRRKYCSTEPGFNTNADAVCPVTCNKCPIDRDDDIEPVESPSSSRPTEGPTTAPTSAPTASPADYFPQWRTNAVPASPHDGYFNYDPSDKIYGPSAWGNMREDEVRHTAEYKYWKEFEEEMRHVDLDHNYCADERKDGRRYIQTPIDISDEAVDGECLEYHQVRDKPGNYVLDEDEVQMQILPSKLRIKWPRTFDKNVCPLTNETESAGVRCPPSADIPKAWGDHLPVIHTDFKMPSEHTLNGKRFAGEYQIWHWQSSGKGAPVINVLVDAPATPGKKEEDYYNEYFQVAIDEWKRVFVSKEDCMARKGLSRLLAESTASGSGKASRHHLFQGSGPKDQAHVRKETAVKHTRHGKNPRLRRKLDSYRSEGSGTNFHPYHPSLIPSVWFYGYDRVGLTEPPCTPIASYHIIDTPMRISTSQLRELQHLLFSHVDMQLTDKECNPTGVHFEGSVARPIQPLGEGRGLHRCTCENFFADKFRKKVGLRDCKKKRRFEKTGQAAN